MTAAPDTDTDADYGHDGGAAIIALGLGERAALGALIRGAIAEGGRIGPAVAAAEALVVRVCSIDGDDPATLRLAWAAVAAVGWLAPVTELRAALAELRWDSDDGGVRDRAELELDVAAALRDGAIVVPRELTALFAAHWLGDASHAAAEGTAALEVLRDRPDAIVELFDELARLHPGLAERFEARLDAELPPERTDPSCLELHWRDVGVWSGASPLGFALIGALIALGLGIPAVATKQWEGAILCGVALVAIVVATLVYYGRNAPKEARRRVARLAVKRGLTMPCVVQVMAAEADSAGSIDMLAGRIARGPGLRLFCSVAALAVATAELSG